MTIMHTRRKFLWLAPDRLSLCLALCAATTGMMATKVSANTPEADAQAFNSAFELNASFERSPVEMFTMQLCSALWNHWDTIVSGSNDSKFTGSLRPELTSENAKSRKIYLDRMARREINDDNDEAEFQRAKASAQSMADEIYEKYTNDNKAGAENLAGWLGEC